MTAVLLIWRGSAVAISDPVVDWPPVAPVSVAPSNVTAVPEDAAPAAACPEKRSANDHDAARKAMLAYIAASAKGRSWMEITRRFPEHAGCKPILEEMVKKGALRKTGNRYLKPVK